MFNIFTLNSMIACLWRKNIIRFLKYNYERRVDIKRTQNWHGVGVMVTLNNLQYHERELLYETEL